MLREELAEKILPNIRSWDFDNITKMEVAKIHANFILSPQCLKMLLPMYEVSQTGIEGILSQVLTSSESFALSKSNVIKVKQGD